LGILSILDEECEFPQATDRKAVSRSQNRHHIRQRAAHEVLYDDVSGFLNRDSLRNELAVLAQTSELSFVKMLFEEERDAPSSRNTD